MEKPAIGSLSGFYDVKQHHFTTPDARTTYAHMMRSRISRQLSGAKNERLAKKNLKPTQKMLYYKISFRYERASQI